MVRGLDANRRNWEDRAALNAIQIAELFVARGLITPKQKAA